MAKARALDKRRKSVKNIRKITRTMELIANARFKKAMDRATAATAYTNRITKLVRDLAQSGAEVKHPLLEPHAEVKHVRLLVLTANRGLCGGYNGSVIRLAQDRYRQLTGEFPEVAIEMSGKRGISAFRYRQIPVAVTYTQFEDKPSFDEVDRLATQYLEDYILGKLDRLEVVYTQFRTIAKQTAVVETLLPLASLDAGTPEAAGSGAVAGAGAGAAKAGESMYEFIPSAASILQEVVPTSFKTKLFKCFLDAAVSEQVARMVAMKAATENAGDLIRSLSLTYNRARQSQITGEIMEIIGGVEALNK
ncbi:MAG: ATP synthase F1 subunit gamma [Pirellulales bacterium]